MIYTREEYKLLNSYKLLFNSFYNDLLNTSMGYISYRDNIVNEDQQKQISPGSQTLLLQINYNNTYVTIQLNMLPALPIRCAGPCVGEEKNLPSSEEGEKYARAKC